MKRIAALSIIGSRSCPLRKSSRQSCCSAQHFPLAVMRQPWARLDLDWVEDRNLANRVSRGLRAYRASECACAGARSRDSDKAPQTTVNSSDLVPTRPKLSAIWIVTLWRPRGSSASSTVTPDTVGLACASIRLVMSMPREPYLTRRLFGTIVALPAV